MNDADRFAWVQGYEEQVKPPMVYPDAFRVRYRLRPLAEQAFIQQWLASNLLADSGLSELGWYMVWHDPDPTPSEALPQRIAEAEGFVIFLHGWDGNHDIWEDLPEAVVSRNPRLVAFVFDHNGFGSTSFVDETPDIALCNPPAAMRVIERWINLMRLRNTPDTQPRRVINFVGHSMGGATLFYLNEAYWQPHEQTRYPLAPALLLEDELHRLFYQALSIGIDILDRLPDWDILDRLDDLLAPTFVDILAGGASQVVQTVHETMYKTTPKGVTARTFAAMGRLDQAPPPSSWFHFRVALGSEDALVGLNPMHDLLDKLVVPKRKVRVFEGDHYFFSIGEKTHAAHSINREVVIQDILEQHHTAFRLLNA